MDGRQVSSLCVYSDRILLARCCAGIQLWLRDPSPLRIIRVVLLVMVVFVLLLLAMTAQQQRYQGLS
eukprot:COSAG01_NODE_2256_length_8067_cov_5.797691_14_plen_67_part_00